jgi:hypothetical protein
MRIPDGANGVVLYSNDPKTWAYAESFLFSLELRRRFSVMMAWLMRRHHRCMGKWPSTVLRPAMKWALNVWIILYAALC